MSSYKQELTIGGGRAGSCALLVGELHDRKQRERLWKIHGSKLYECVKALT